MTRAAAEDGDAPRIVIIGGGYTGAIVALNLARHSTSALDVTVVEPRPWLGGGVAYSTHDPAHRVNVPSTRMSVFSDDELHFDRWIKEHGAVAGDPEATLADGRVFPRRLVFGTYVRSELAGAFDGSRVRLNHVQDEAVRAEQVGNTWHIVTAGGQSVEADILILAASHPPPAAPSVFAPLLPHTRITTNPWAPDALTAINPHDTVLIVGTALSMGDIIGSLERRGHDGHIIAVSRRGLVSRGHVWGIQAFGQFGSPPPVTARALIRRIREALASAQLQGLPWQSVLDAVRRDAAAIWQALPQVERSRLVRHARSFWDVHRYRIAPQVEAAIERRRIAGMLEIVSASIRAVQDEPSGIGVELFLRGSAGGTLRHIVVDRVVLATGPGHGAIFRTNPLIAGLVDTGHVQPDGLDLGILVDEDNAPIGRDGRSVPNILVAGPLARGTIGELMGLPQVTKHAEQVAQAVLTTIGSGQIPARATIPSAELDLALTGA